MYACLGQRLNANKFVKILKDAKEQGQHIQDALYRMAGKKKNGKPATGMTQRLWREYMLNTFLPKLKGKGPALLIIDGAACHMDFEFLLKCKEFGVDVVQAPAHTSSLTQVRHLQAFCIHVPNMINSHITMI